MTEAGPLRRLLRLVSWPVWVGATCIGFLLTFASGYVESGLVLVPAVAIVALLGLELLIPDRPGAGSLRDPQLWNDAVHAVAGQGGGNALGQSVFVLAAAWLAGEVSQRWGGSLWPAEWPFWVQVPLLVFVADGLDYWRHRWMHTVGWLWPVHVLHHDGDRLNALKAGRGHLLDMLLRNLLCYAPLALAGVPREVLLTHAAAITVFGPIAHANVSLRVPSFLHRWVMTPQVHRIHHALPIRLSSSNYANVFPIWDIAFGSFEHPDHQPPFDYGVEGDPGRTDVVGQLVAPFDAWRSAWRSRGSKRAGPIGSRQVPG